MVEGRSGKKLGRTTSHRFALFSNLAKALIINNEIRTTEAKAKELRRYVDSIITVAKRGGLSGIRQVKKKIGDKEAIKKIFENIVPGLKDRPGGYTRMVKIGYRTGDRAKMVMVKLILPEDKEGKK